MIAGRYFDGISSVGIPAHLALDADGIARLHGLPYRIEAPAGALGFSERVGSIPRRVTFPDGGVFETTDNDSIDDARAALGLKGGTTWLHRLESRWPIVLSSLAAIVLLSVTFVQWGVPALANQAARMMPVQADRAIGIGTLDIFDRSMFDPSKLPAERRTALTRRFADMTAPLDDGHQYRLEFRRSAAIGANAFALPSGIVVITDDLVKIAKSDDEIIAVLAHEIGHVRGRHALRQLLQAAGISALAVAVLGDVSSFSAILGAAPALLHAKHSRDFEREADTFAKEWLRAHDIDETNFDAILCRMTRPDGKSDAEAIDYFASHPPTDERARCSPEPGNQPVN
jgi:Zn-dependent protease with chaperone function